MKSHRGFTLIELLIVMAVGMVMLTVATSVLYLLKETQANVRRRLLEGRIIVRLADQFRADVHAARVAESVDGESDSPDASVWLLHIESDTRVRYETEGERVRRVRLVGNEKMHEDYRLPQGTNAEISIPESNSGLATLRIERIGPGVGNASTIRVDALLGFDDRHNVHSRRTTE